VESGFAHLVLKRQSESGYQAVTTDAPGFVVEARRMTENRPTGSIILADHEVESLLDSIWNLGYRPDGYIESGLLTEEREAPEMVTLECHIKTLALYARVLLGVDDT
jgi:hypothetical protein